MFDIHFNKCVNPFLNDLVKRIYKGRCVINKTESDYVGIAKFTFPQK